MVFERHCWAEIDLDALRGNFAQVQARAAGRPVCAVIKADAYGHGDTVVARTLAKAGAAAFAVSCLAEGVRLRGLSEYYMADKSACAPDTVVAGYAALKSEDIEAVAAALARAWRV